MANQLATELPALLWRWLEDYALVEVRHLPFSVATDTWGTEYQTSILKCEVDGDGSIVHLLSGPALVDVTEDELRDDMERWYVRETTERGPLTRYHDEMEPTWERTRAVVARLEAEIAARRAA